MTTNPRPSRTNEPDISLIPRQVDPHISAVTIR